MKKNISIIDYNNFGSKQQFVNLLVINLSMRYSNDGNDLLYKISSNLL